MPISTTGKASIKNGSSSFPAFSARGFSLIELMIVLVIMALVLAMAGPRVTKSMGVLQLRTTAKQITASLRWARSHAVSTGKAYNAIFDCAGRRVIISDYAGAYAADPPKLVQVEGGQEILGDSIGASFDSDESSRKPVLKIFKLPENIFFREVAIADLREPDPGDESIFQLTFFPDGTCLGAEITIADEQNRSFLITVDFLTGIVSLEEPEN